jgi:hypothetical protein
MRVIADERGVSRGWASGAALSAIEAARCAASLRGGGGTVTAGAALAALSVQVGQAVDVWAREYIQVCLDFLDSLAKAGR